MRLIMLGAPGSGKRALLKRIVADHPVLLIDANDLMEDAATETMEGGERPVYELPLDKLRARLCRENLSGGFILDILPGALEQAAALDGLLHELGVPLDLVLAIETDQDALLERLTGRLTCRDCGATQNIFTDPPRVDGVCDQCGGALRRSPKASEQTFHQRLRMYESRALPLLGYYAGKGLLRRIRGEAEPEDLYAAARRIIGDLERTLTPPPPLTPEISATPEPASVATPEDAQPTGPMETASWKRGAEHKGRLKRHHGQDKAEAEHKGKVKGKAGKSGKSHS